MMVDTGDADADALRRQLEDEMKAELARELDELNASVAASFKQQQSQSQQQQQQHVRSTTTSSSSSAVPSSRPGSRPNSRPGSARRTRPGVSADAFAGRPVDASNAAMGMEVASLAGSDEDDDDDESFKRALADPLQGMALSSAPVSTAAATSSSSGAAPASGSTAGGSLRQFLAEAEKSLEADERDWKEQSEVIRQLTTPYAPPATDELPPRPSTGSRRGQSSQQLLADDGSPPVPSPSPPATADASSLTVSHRAGATASQAMPPLPGAIGSRPSTGLAGSGVFGAANASLIPSSIAALLAAIPDKPHTPNPIAAAISRNTLSSAGGNGKPSTPNPSHNPLLSASTSSLGRDVLLQAMEEKSRETFLAEERARATQIEALRLAENKRDEEKQRRLRVYEEQEQRLKTAVEAAQRTAREVEEKRQKQILENKLKHEVFLREQAAKRKEQDHALGKLREQQQRLRTPQRPATSSSTTPVVTDSAASSAASATTTRLPTPLLSSNGSASSEPPATATAAVTAPASDSMAVLAAAQRERDRDAWFKEQNAKLRLEREILLMGMADRHGRALQLAARRKADEQAAAAARQRAVEDQQREQQLRALQREQERLAREAAEREHALRLAKERAERERLERVERERAEQQRLDAEREAARVAEEKRAREAAEAAERTRKAAEEAERARLEAARLAREAEARRIADATAAAERVRKEEEERRRIREAQEKRKRDEEMRARRLRAAVCIQKYARRFLIRRKHPIARQLKAVRKFRTPARLRLVVRMQAWWRGVRHRRRMAGVTAAARRGLVDDLDEELGLVLGGADFASAVAAGGSAGGSVGGVKGRGGRGSSAAIDLRRSTEFTLPALALPDFASISKSLPATLPVPPPLHMAIPLPYGAPPPMPPPNMLFPFPPPPMPFPGGVAYPNGAPLAGAAAVANATIVSTATAAAAAAAAASRLPAIGRGPGTGGPAAFIVPANLGGSTATAGPPSARSNAGASAATATAPVPVPPPAASPKKQLQKEQESAIMKDWNFMNPAVAAALLKRNKRLEKLKKAKDKPSASKRLEVFQKKAGVAGSSPPRSSDSQSSQPPQQPRLPSGGKGKRLPAWFLGPAPQHDSPLYDTTAAATGADVQAVRPTSADVEVQSVRSSEDEPVGTAPGSLPHVTLAFDAASAAPAGNSGRRAGSGSGSGSGALARKR